MTQKAVIYVAMEDPDAPGYGNMDLRKPPSLLGKGSLLWHVSFRAGDLDGYHKAKMQVEDWAETNGYEIIGVERY